MTNLSLTDRSLLWQIRLISTKDNIKTKVIDSLFRREEGMEMVQAAILVAFAVAAAGGLFALKDKILAVFTHAGNELDRY